MHELADQYSSLKYVLGEYMKTDMLLLEQLLMPDSKGDTPIHYALEKNNHKCVNEMLSCLAESDNCYSDNFKDKFHELVGFPNF